MSETIFTDANFEAEVLKSEGVVLVDFFAPWCGPCKMMSPVIDKLAEEYKGKVKIGKMDVDESGETAMKYEVQSIPTLIIFKNGAIADKLIGFQSEESLKEKLDANI